ncbi:MAG: DUF3575 domain-containing protein [Gemmatimonadaceae bacterium]
MRRNMVLVNPLAAIFNVFSGEYERAVSPSTTLGAAGTYYGFTDDNYDYSTVEIKLRYYPQEQALSGFSIGASAGATRVSTDLLCSGSGSGYSCKNDPGTQPTLGIELDYNWLLGPSRRFAVGTGIGAKRLLGTSADYSGLKALPTGRLSVGLAF